MADKFISADKLIEGIVNRNNGTMDKSIITIDSLLSIIDNIPPADVVEVKHGEWVHIGKMLIFYECSECEFVYEEDYDYCPHCGAKMNGGENK